MLRFLLLVALVGSVPGRGAPALWDGLVDNALGPFSKERVWMPLTAVGLTALLVFSGTDAAVFEAVRDDGELSSYSRPFVRFGSYAPLYLGGLFLLHGLAASDDESLTAAFAVAQSTVLIVSTTLLLKAITGRVDADVNSSESAFDQSKDWRFGFLRHGVYNGWPSGHVGTTTAALATLMHFYPDASWLKWVGYAAITAMVAAVTVHARGQMHWLSESVAGALIGYAVGWAVGSHFRSALEQGRASDPSALILPLGVDAPGVQFSFAF